jgi:hypothetical protein
MESTYKYDVALSFAGEDREVASSFARLAQASDLKVFIDEEHLWEAWGKNLNEYLADVYYNQSRYCVIIISKDYCQKAYTNLERRIALDRVLTSKEVTAIKKMALPDSLFMLPPGYKKEKPLR